MKNIGKVIYWVIVAAITIGLQVMVIRANKVLGYDAIQVAVQFVVATIFPLAIAWVVYDGHNKD